MVLSPAGCQGYVWSALFIGVPLDCNRFRAGLFSLAWSTAPKTHNGAGFIQTIRVFIKNTLANSTYGKLGMCFSKLVYSEAGSFMSRDIWYWLVHSPCQILLDNDQDLPAILVFCRSRNFEPQHAGD